MRVRCVVQQCSEGPYAYIVRVGVDLCKDVFASAFAFIHAPVLSFLLHVGLKLSQDDCLQALDCLRCRSPLPRNASPLG